MQHFQLLGGVGRPIFIQLCVLSLFFDRNSLGHFLAMAMETTTTTTATPEVTGSGRRRLSLETWVCLPILRPVRTSSSSSSGSSCVTTSKVVEKETSKVVVDEVVVVSAMAEDLEVAGGCETPKSKEHRIPDVDVTFCPPAPRKPRAMARRRRVQPTSFFNTPDFENFLSQHKVQVSS